ncbi:hypothetical protein [Nocardioides aurantiacus]|uniref:Uncharacterized protein n=1 Tax=Nocardioides aurantiacus TaxID=86796 RepID=A0A3N2CW09_9ACTN|nr:hypothetical protein [Nocardioides aurantiacus]ROR91721.1 hypothetical protein EDD33_2596 [Nocardioides aurantiacus]
MTPLTHLHTGRIANTLVLVRTYADHTLTIEPLDADGRGTGECELTAQGVS